MREDLACTGQPARQQRERSALVVLLSLLLMVVAGNIVLWLLGSAVELPLRLTVRSAGFAFPAMAESGQLIRNIVLGGLLVAAVSWRLLRPCIATRNRSRLDARGLSARELGVVCAGIAFLWGLYAAYPPQISYTNFKILWVDWAGADAKVRYFGQILRGAFYSYPHLLQAAATLLSFLSFQGIGRRFGYGIPGASVLALAFCVSAVFVQFAGVGEDWLVITAGSLAVLWAYSGRRWGVMVLALVGLGGLRLPASFLVLFAVSLVEVARVALVAWEKPRPPWAPLALAIGRVAFAWAAVLAGSYLGFLHFAAYGEGDLAGVSFGPDMAPIAVDGFTLSRFSGAYVAHGFWSLPPVVLASCVLVLAFARPLLRTTRGRTALASALAFGGTILMYEAVTEFQFYYNYRYLAMSVPFGLVALLYVLAKFRTGRAVAFAAVLGVLVSHPCAAVPEGGASSRQRLEHALYSCRHVLSPVLQGRTVYVTSKSKSLANSVAYVAGPTGAAKRMKGTRQFEQGELVLLEKGRSSRKLARRSDLQQVAACRGWVVLAPR